jgi:cation transport ATPase
MSSKIAVVGEPEPVNKKKTQRVSSGTVVQNGYLEIKIDTEIEESTIRKLNQAVLDVQADKVNIVNLTIQPFTCTVGSG